MRKIVHEKLEKARIRDGIMWTNSSDGLIGAFRIVFPLGHTLHVISSGPYTDTGWEHVSVSAMDRCPTWPEMCVIKELFWSRDECVVQFHPPDRDYINAHPFCLHLWKPINIALPMPPKDLIA
jgi:hypothetical protein